MNVGLGSRCNQVTRTACSQSFDERHEINGTVEQPVLRLGEVRRFRPSTRQERDRRECKSHSLTESVHGRYDVAEHRRFLASSYKEKCCLC